MKILKPTICNCSIHYVSPVVQLTEELSSSSLSSFVLSGRAHLKVENDIGRNIHLCPKLKSKRTEHNNHPYYKRFIVLIRSHYNTIPYMSSLLSLILILSFSSILAPISNRGSEYISHSVYNFSHQALNRLVFAIRPQKSWSRVTKSVVL